jgi:uncharacterized protein
MNNLIIRFSDFLETTEVSRKQDKLKLNNIGCDSDLAVSVKAVKISEDRVYVSGAIKGCINLECSRCLFMYRQNIEIPIAIDLGFIDEVVDINEEVRQLMLLEMPMKPLCSSDCLGICPECGKHKRIGDSCNCRDSSQVAQDEFMKERWKNLFKNNRRK